MRFLITLSLLCFALTANAQSDSEEQEVAGMLGAGTVFEIKQRIQFGVVEGKNLACFQYDGVVAKHGIITPPVKPGLAGMMCRVFPRDPKASEAVSGKCVVQGDPVWELEHSATAIDYSQYSWVFNGEANRGCPLESLHCIQGLFNRVISVKEVRETLNPYIKLTRPEEIQTGHARGSAQSFE